MLERLASLYASTKEDETGPISPDDMSKVAVLGKDLARI